MNNSEDRGRKTEGRGQRSEVSGQRSDIGLSTFRPSTFRHRNQRGMTLIEVMLSAAILGILAVAVATALFYPSYQVVNSSLEQSAIHAGTAEIEGRLYNPTNPVPLGIFKTAGWSLMNVTTTVTNWPPDYGPDFGGEIGDEADYLKIKTTIEYRDGKTVELITYRSLEVINSSR